MAPTKRDPVEAAAVAAAKKLTPLDPRQYPKTVYSGPRGAGPLVVNNPLELERARKGGYKTDDEYRAESGLKPSVY